MTVRVALVGIDGSGKSSVIARLNELLTDFYRPVATMHCPDFHANYAIPMAELSYRLKAVGEAADRAGHARIKAATLFLRMTLFGDVERFISEQYRPQLMVSERHPIVETLVYAPVYERLVKSSRPSEKDVAAIFADADLRCPGAGDTLRSWQAQVVERTGLAADLATVVESIVALIGLDPTGAVAALGDVYRTSWPNLVLWLDSPPEICAERCMRRSVREVHEDPATLHRLRTSYEQVTASLRVSGSMPPIVRIEAAAVDSVESSARNCLAAIEQALTK